MGVQHLPRIWVLLDRFRKFAGGTGESKHLCENGTLFDGPAPGLCAARPAFGRFNPAPEFLHRTIFANIEIQVMFAVLEAVGVFAEKAGGDGVQRTVVEQVAEEVDNAVSPAFRRSKYASTFLHRTAAVQDGPLHHYSRIRYGSASIQGEKTR